MTFGDDEDDGMDWQERERRLIDRLNELAAGYITWTTFGGSVPVQGEGRTVDDDEVYFRFRFNAAQLYIYDGDEGRDNTKLYAELEDVYTRDDGTPDEYAGMLTHDQAVDLVQRLVADLRPVADWPGGTRVERVGNLLRAIVEAHRRDQPD